MARPRDPRKKDALLKAAAQAVGEKGLDVSTGVIARAAGVAEGTLFTYFPTKDVLLNALYVALKAQLRAELHMPPTLPPKEQLRHVWEGYLHWGRTHPNNVHALARLAAWHGLTPESRKAAEALFPECHDFQENTGHHASFLTATFQALADMVLRHTLTETPGTDTPDALSETARDWSERCFALLWQAVETN